MALGPGQAIFVVPMLQMKCVQMATDLLENVFSSSMGSSPATLVVSHTAPEGQRSDSRKQERRVRKVSSKSIKNAKVTHHAATKHWLTSCTPLLLPQSLFSI